MCYCYPDQLTCIGCVAIPIHESPVMCYRYDCWVEEALPVCGIVQYLHEDPFHDKGLIGETIVTKPYPHHRRCQTLPQLCLTKQHCIGRHNNTRHFCAWWWAPEMCVVLPYFADTIQQGRMIGSQWGDCWVITSHALGDSINCSI